MNKALESFAPEYITEGYTTTYLTPYENEQWKVAVENFGISLPKEIIHRGDGLSVCPECKAVYAGYQRRCTKKVRKVSYSHYGRNWAVSNLNIGDKIEVKGYSNSHSIVDGERTEECMEECVWDKREEFQFQRDFFNLLGRIAYLDLESTCPLRPFAQYIPHSQYEKISANLLRAEIFQIKNNQEQIKHLLEEVVNKMNMAGHSLSW